MAKAPAFQFYANDFMDATSMWEANAVGLYVRCLCKQWTHGSIPSDLRILARMIHCDREELQSCWSVLGSKFEQQEDGTLKNRRLEEVRERQEYVSSKRSEAGKAGAIAKANAKANGSTKDKQRKVKEKEKVENEVEGGSEERERAPQMVYPAWATPEFAVKWSIWKRYKAEKGKKYKPMGEQAALIKLAKDYTSEADCMAAIDYSMGQNYEGIYPEKKPTTLFDNGNRTQKLADALARQFGS